MFLQRYLHSEGRNKYFILDGMQTFSSHELNAYSQ